MNVSDIAMLGIAGYIIMTCLRETYFDIDIDKRIGAATANVGTYEGKALLPQDYVAAIVSSRQNDMAWKAPQTYSATALEGVGYPMFRVNFPRLDDHQF